MKRVATGMSIAALTVLPLGGREGGLLAAHTDLLPVGIAVAVLSTVVPFSLEHAALKRLPARTFGVLMSLEPAVAALCGLGFLGERLGSAQWVAIALVIAASIGAAATTREASAPIEV